MESVCERCLGTSRRTGGAVLGWPGDDCEICGQPILPTGPATARNDDTIEVFSTSPFLPPPLPADGEPWGPPGLRHSAPPRIALPGARADLRRIGPLGREPMAKAAAAASRGKPITVAEDGSIRPLAGEAFGLGAPRQPRPRSRVAGALTLCALAFCLGLVSRRGSAPDAAGSRPADWSGAPAAQVPADPGDESFEENEETTTAPSMPSGPSMDLADRLEQVPPDNLVNSPPRL